MNSIGLVARSKSDTKITTTFSGSLSSSPFEIVTKRRGGRLLNGERGATLPRPLPLISLVRSPV